MFSFFNLKTAAPIVPSLFSAHSHLNALDESMSFMTEQDTSTSLDLLDSSMDTSMLDVGGYEYAYGTDVGMDMNMDMSAGMDMGMSMGMDPFM